MKRSCILCFACGYIPFKMHFIFYLQLVSNCSRAAHMAVAVAPLFLAFCSSHPPSFALSFFFSDDTIYSHPGCGTACGGCFQRPAHPHLAGQPLKGTTVSAILHCLRAATWPHGNLLSPLIYPDTWLTLPGMARDADGNLQSGSGGGCSTSFRPHCHPCLRKRAGHWDRSKGRVGSRRPGSGA